MAKRNALAIHYFTKARAAALAYDDANVKNDRPEKYLNFPAGEIWF